MSTAGDHLLTCLRVVLVARSSACHLHNVSFNANLTPHIAVSSPHSKNCAIWPPTFWGSTQHNREDVEGHISGQ